jgi:hypothetical protein
MASDQATSRTVVTLRASGAPGVIQPSLDFEGVLSARQSVHHLAVMQAPDHVPASDHLDRESDLDRVRHRAMVQDWCRSSEPLLFLAHSPYRS